MKSVLIVAYYFPPSGGPGVQRVLKMVKDFPDFGWRPVVLTVANGEFPARDESLLAEIPAGVPVYRTRILEPYGLYRALTGRRRGQAIDVNVIPRRGARRPWRERVAALVRATFFIPDARIGWYPSAVREGMRVIAREGIDAIYSSSPPHTCAVIARRLHRRSRRPWVVGFRDPWTGFENAPPRWPLPEAIDRHLEAAVCRDADAIDVAWLGIQRDLMRKHPEVPAGKFIHLPNGFDGADYPALTPEPHERFTLGYTGSLYGTRNPASLLRAVEGLVREGRVDPHRVVLKFVGRFGTDVETMFASSPLRASIDVVPYLPHRASIEALLRADALLLVVDEIAGSAGVVPGKVYEYLGARRPILAIADPAGAIADLLRETGAGRTLAHADVEGIAATFETWYRAFLDGRPAVADRPEVIARYERRETTRRLAALLDELTIQSAS